MFWWNRRICVAAMVLATAGALVPAAATGGTATVTSWTKISADTRIAQASAGLWRTADGRLHVVWPSSDSGPYSLHYSTVGPQAKLLASGTVVKGWSAVSFYPRLVAGPGGGIRLIFTGGNGQSGSPYNLGAVYSATSTSAGTAWALAKGSLSHSTIIPLTDEAAATEGNGTPVAAWSGGGLDYHVGIDPNIPAKAPDQQVAVNAGSVVVGPALARNSDGSIWAAWFTASGKSDQGYWADKIFPSKAAKAKAPDSGGSTGNNQPFQPAAFTARTGGGLYLAYCTPSATFLCGHINLWKAGAATAVTVPGSTNGHAVHVAIAAAPGGHLWVMWYDTALNKIKLVRTNSAGTRFGAVQTLAVPPLTDQFDALGAEGSQGPLDMVALVVQNVSGSTPAYWATETLPKLGLTGSPSTVSHTLSTTVTFKVTDVGDPVAGASVTFLGKTVTTSSAGIVKITVPKGTPTGDHTATASKGGYTSATFTIKVT
jgi:hypothetical protein